MTKTAALICPESRPGLEFFIEGRPLALAPLCGQSLLDRGLTELGREGFTRVDLYLSDRPEMIREQLRDGKKWGLEVKVHPTQAEPTPDDIRNKASSAQETEGLPEVFILDRIPLTNSSSLFNSYQAWFETLCDLINQSGKAQLGMQEKTPGVWVGIGTRLSESVKLIAPCWVGRNAFISENVTIGPNAIVEDYSFIDTDAIISNSQVAQNTYIGVETEVNDSFVWGDRLLNWRRGSGQVIRDPLLLSRFDNPDPAASDFSSGLAARLGAFVLLLLLSPLALLILTYLKLTKGQALITSEAVVPGAKGPHQVSTKFKFSDFNLSSLRLRRIPRLWSILTGRMAWVGNPPLTPGETDLLETEFDQLWLQSPVGLVSLGDCYDSIDPSDHEARTHAAYFGAKNDAKTTRRILAWLFFNRQA